MLCTARFLWWKGQELWQAGNSPAVEQSLKNLGVEFGMEMNNQHGLSRPALALPLVPCCHYVFNSRCTA